VNGVWTTVNAADSAARAMAAAGDSLARAAAFDELSARRAALEATSDTLADSTLAFVPRRRVTTPDSARADSGRVRADSAVRARVRPDTAKPRVIVPPPALRTGPPPGVR
jgi:rod shape-determining protein MreC